MAQQPQFNPNEYESKQSALLNESSQNLRMECVVCTKSKKALYLCHFNNCPQAKRLLCKKCGKNTHENDNDDDDEDDDNDDIKIDHTFDINASYVEKFTPSLQLSQQHKRKIQASAREMKLMIKTKEENQRSTNRNKFEMIVGYGANAIIAQNGVQRIPSLEVVEIVENSSQILWTSLKNGEIKQFAKQLNSTVLGITDTGLELTKTYKEGAFVASSFVFTCEVIYHTYRLAKGDSTFKQYYKKIVTSAAVSAGGAIGNIGGSALGGVIGTILLPGIGTSVGSILGGLFGAVFGGIATKKTIEEISWFNDKNEQQCRYALLRDALIQFNFEFKDLTNKNIFNEKEINKRFKSRAKEAHPDMPGGSQNKFVTLTSNMAMLLAMLEQTDNAKKETSKIIETLAITLPKKSKTIY